MEMGFCVEVMMGGEEGLEGEDQGDQHSPEPLVVLVFTGNVQCEGRLWAPLLFLLETGTSEGGAKPRGRGLLRSHPRPQTITFPPAPTAA